MTEQPLDRRELKIEALRQRIAEITVQYEDKDADRRVLITEMEQHIKNLNARIAELEAPDETETEEADGEED